MLFTDSVRKVWTASSARTTGKRLKVNVDAIGQPPTSGMSTRVDAEDILLTLCVLTTKKDMQMLYEHFRYVIQPINKTNFCMGRTTTTSAGSPTNSGGGGRCGTLPRSHGSWIDEVYKDSAEVTCRFLKMVGNFVSSTGTSNTRYELLSRAVVVETRQPIQLGMWHSGAIKVLTRSLFMIPS